MIRKENKADQGAYPVAAAKIAISDGEFRYFQRFMFERAGVNIAPSKKALICGRLNRRIITRGCANFSAYTDILNSDQQECQVALDLLTTNETYFFREPKHFTFLRETIIPAHKRSDSFRAWSAACSSGEEVYSIAMELAEAQGNFNWSVLGSDLNSQVLRRAVSAHYSFARADGIPIHYLHQYCLKGKASQSGTFLIARHIRERTEFRQINLNQALPVLPSFDIIFLRNVLIYFSQQTKLQVIKRISAALRPGGYLIIGHSESLSTLSTDLTLIRPSIYKKSM